MEVNVPALLKLLEEEFDGSQIRMAEAFGINRTHLNTVLKNNGKGAGGDFCGSIIKWCETHGRYYKEFIILA